MLDFDEQHMSGLEVKIGEDLESIDVYLERCTAREMHKDDEPVYADLRIVTGASVTTITGLSPKSLRGLAKFLSDTADRYEEQQ